MNQPKIPVDHCDIHQAATSQTGRVSVTRSANVEATTKEDAAAPDVKSTEIELEDETLNVNAAVEVKAVPTSVGKNDMNPENHHDALGEYGRRIADGNVENGTTDRKQCNTVMSMKDVYEPHPQ